MSRELERFGMSGLSAASMARRDHTRLFFEDTHAARTHVHNPDGSMNLTDFKPCPICGNMAEDHDDGIRSWADCVACGITYNSGGLVLGEFDRAGILPRCG